MDYQTATPEELLHALEWAGRTPDLDLIRACLERPGELTAGLLEMLAADPLEAYDDLDDDVDNDPRSYADIHAGLLLIAYREEQALPIFAGVWRNPEREHLLEWFDTELHHYGPAPVPMLLDLAHDEEVQELGRYSAVEALAEIGRQYPETRDAVVAGLRSLLPDLRQDGTLPAGFEIDEIWTWVASALAQLRDEESKAQVIALYRAGLIEEFLMGDLDDYLGNWDKQPLGQPRHFDLLGLYEGLHRQVASDREWQARREAIETAPPESIARPGDTRSQSAPGSAYPKAGRNDPCPCGSGLKYKKCHGRPGT